jgi:hypothetical protein
LNRKYAEKPPMIIVQGSCHDFIKERPKLVNFIDTLELGARTQSQFECSSVGKALGWEFFQIYFDPDFVEKLLDIYPDIQKQEGNDIEQRFVLWLNKQLKKAKMEYYLKLSDVPRVQTRGFRLNPEDYRDEKELEDLR